MKLNKPKNITFLIAIIIAVLGLIGHFASIPFVSANDFWFVVVGFVLLALGNLVKGL